MVQYIGQYEDFANEYLTVGTQYRDNWMCVCLFHDDHSPSMSFNIHNGAFLCFSCKAKGNIITLARKLGMIVKANGFIPALDDPAAELSGLDRMLDEQQNGPEPATPTVLDETFAERYMNTVGALAYWMDERGLNLETIRKFKLGYDTMQDAATIPMRDAEGRLLGIARRNLSGTGPKYYTPRGYVKTEFLYGYWPDTTVQIDRTGQPHHVVLVEGQVDALKVWQAGYNVGAVMGSGLSKAQRRLLYRSSVNEITLFFDNDKPGFQMAMSALGMLRRNMRIYAAFYHEDDPNDPGAMTMKQVKRAISRRIELDDFE
jgi:DNA primase